VNTVFAFKLLLSNTKHYIFWAAAIDEHPKDASPSPLVDIELLHVRVAEEVFRRGEYQVDPFGVQRRRSVLLQGVLVEGDSVDMGLLHPFNLWPVAQKIGPGPPQRSETLTWSPSRAFRGETMM
jgi:hypothetical protein